MIKTTKIDSITLLIVDKIVALRVNDKTVYKYLQNLYRSTSFNSSIDLTISVQVVNGKAIVTSDVLSIQFLIFPKKHKYLNAIDYIIRYLIEIHMQRFNIFFLHASSYIYKRRAYVFTGKSGAGKTTILLNAPIRQRVSEDITLIKMTEKGALVGQSPFESNKSMTVKEPMYQLGAIYAIRQSSHDKISSASLSRRLSTLLYNNIVIGGFDDSYHVKINNHRIVVNSKKRAYNLFLDTMQRIDISQLDFTKTFKMSDVLP